MISPSLRELNNQSLPGEYIRLAYRSVNPRPLRDVSGDVVLVTGAGESEQILKELQQVSLRVNTEYCWITLIGC